MRRLLFSFIVFCCFLQGNAQTVVENDGQNLINSVVWMQKSGEYRALAYQAYQLGQTRLAEIIAHKKTDKPKAVVLDIDETVLDNSPMEAYEIKKGKEFSHSDWREWVDLSDAKPVPGALKFLNFAKNNGVTIFYITNRSEKSRAQTLKNLEKMNFPFADNQHLILKSEKSSSKETRRRNVAKNYDIVLFFGDNLGDFSDMYYHNSEGKTAAQVVDENPGVFGEKFIILPNAMYGGWSNELRKSVKGAEELNSKQVKLKSLVPFK